MCAESANLTGDKRDRSVKITKSAKTVAKDNIIEVKHYKMVFADKTVIKDLSFEVKKGEVFGLLGSNGSGKTTTIRTLLGLYQATDGKLLINGKPFSPEDDIRVGYLPEERGLYKKESVIDTMVYFARLKGVKNPREWSMNFLSRVGLEDSAKTRIDKLSQGMQQKVQLGITVMNEPELLILDAYFIQQNLPVPSSLEGKLERFSDERFIAISDNGTYSITALGALLFARNLREFPMVASKAIRVILYRNGSRIEAVNDITAYEGYAVSFSPVCNRIYDMVREPEIIRSERREEPMRFPAVAIRELLGNLLIHQDLSVSGSGPLVEVFASRIEGSNPGSLLVPKDRIIDAPPRVRNEALAAFLRRIHICEERGSGFDRMEEGMASMVLPSPLVDTGPDYTRIKLFSYPDFSFWTKDDRIRTCYMTTCLRYIESIPVSNAMLRNRFGIPEKNSAVVSRIVKEAIAENRIRILDESAGAKARRYIPYWA